MQLEAEGDESALSFSLSFDRNTLVYVGAEKGAGAGDAALNINALKAAEGKLGVALAAMNKSFPAGTREMVKVSFRAARTDSGSCPVSLGDQPVPRGVSDTNALVLTANYVNGTIIVNPPPALRILTGDGSFTLAWPEWATNYSLQESPALESSNWTNVATSSALVDGEHRLTLPVGGSTRYYRLQK